MPSLTYDPHLAGSGQIPSGGVRLTVGPPQPPVVSHVGTAALVAAATGALFASLVGAVALANRRLADPHDLDRRGVAVVAAGGLLSGVLFAPLGAERVAAWLSLSAPIAVVVCIAGTVALALLGTLLLFPLVSRYLRWARTPSVLREEREEGFEP